VRWITDHIVLIAALLAVGIVIFGLVFLVVKAIRLWKGAKREIARTTAEINVISTAAANAGQRAQDLAGRQEELTAAAEVLSARLGVLKVILGHASAALAIFRGPLRYLGR
jgi:hypothetical protein